MTTEETLQDVLSSMRLCRQVDVVVSLVSRAYFHGFMDVFTGFLAVLSSATSCSLELSLSSLHLSPIYAPNEPLTTVTMTSLVDIQHRIGAKNHSSKGGKGRIRGEKGEKEKGKRKKGKKGKT